jgi:hypothetical protein
MTLSSRAKNRLIADINEAFSTLGNKLPARSGNNHEPLAWEYFIASHLAKIAEGRRDEAMKKAVSAGIIPDVTDPKEQREPGTNEFVFDGEIVTILLTVAKPRVQYDMKVLSQHLLDAKVKPAVVNAAIEAASKQTRAGHRFTTMLRTNGDTV